MTEFVGYVVCTDKYLYTAETLLEYDFCWPWSPSTPIRVDFLKIHSVCLASLDCDICRVFSLHPGECTC